MGLKINLVRAKTVLVKTNLPGVDWVINPYSGCTFACFYCYAAQIARWRHPGEPWGSFLDVKTNAPSVLRRELRKLERRTGKKDLGMIFFSSVTDPYLGQEAKYQITRECLQVLVDFGYSGKIGLQTKSPLVTRDIDLLGKLKKVSVGFTVTTLDDQACSFLEGKAPPVSSRLKALKKLNQAGIDTYAFIGPILPYFVNNKKKIVEILDQLEEVGVRQVWFEHLNLNPRIKKRLFNYLKQKAPQLIPEFEKADNQEYREKLDKIIKEAMKGRGLKMGLGQVIYHRKLAKK